LWRLLLGDMLNSAAKIERYTRDITFDEFVSDELRVDGVVLNFVIIGEAATRMPAEVQIRAPNVPWRDLRGMRNIIVHAYFAIDLDVVWNTAKKDIPAFAAAVTALIAEDDEP
jgi:uncharacterized protein with HEPN domain